MQGWHPQALGSPQANQASWLSGATYTIVSHCLHHSFASPISRVTKCPCSSNLDAKSCMESPINTASAGSSCWIEMAKEVQNMEASSSTMLDHRRPCFSGGPLSVCRYETVLRLVVLPAHPFRHLHEPRSCSHCHTRNIFLPPEHVAFPTCSALHCQRHNTTKP